MMGFIKHSADCSKVVEWLEISHPGNLRPAEEGYVWTEVPTPVGEWTVALQDGDVVVVPFVRTMERQVARAKMDMLARVKIKRDATEAAGCVTPYGPIDTDRSSQLKIGGASTAALALGENFSTHWRMGNDELVTFDAAKMIEVGLLAVAHVNACQQRKNELDAQINAAETLADLEAIDIEAGWPG